MSSAITRNNTAEFVNTSGDTMTGPLLLPDGSLAAPALAFSGDADGSGTGIYRSAANTMQLVANGGPYLQIAANAVGISSSARIYFGASAFSGSDVSIYRSDTSTLRVANASTGGAALNLVAMTAPAAPASGAVLYIDSADNDLKIKYSDGTVVVIGNKP